MAVKKYKRLLETIGNTPIMQLEFGTRPLLLAKLEMMNPGGSIKDRCALFMINEAESRGILKSSSKCLVVNFAPG